MDADPAVEPELDAFSLVLPLPFRVATTIVFGVWAWGLNLHYLSLVKIDVPALIRYPPRTSHTQPSHHLSTYRFATVLTFPLLGSILIFWLLTRFQVSLVIQWEIIPNLYLLFLAAAFVFPSKIAQNGRYRLLTILRRVSIGGIAETGDGKFGDILMADVLTSYSKVSGDLFVALCMMFSRRHSTAQPDRGCGGTLIVPLLISLPSLIRLRQCLIEFSRVQRANSSGATGYGANGWGGQHLANALKYSSALPVVIFSSLLRDSIRDNGWLSDVALFRFWMISVFANSFYSFYWDVAQDWDLHLFSRRSLRAPSPTMASNSLISAGHKPKPAYPYGLRRHRYFHSPSIYYMVIFLDLLLRCTWSFKLSPHLDHFNDLEGGIWVMELLEVFRRWVWVFFRVETEWVRQLKGEEEARGFLMADFDGDVAGRFDGEDIDRD